ncbi:HesA/MoeB/ThiF family protein [Anaeromyxobacter oryzae]|uniref:Thiamine biosynthesis protein ThiF n=1 Tax=Anaeromyxobacter oryzae TaxID=2918170 RepID=A0ABN6N0L9_9BACT|nr:HesA/MoeB/ThiF family protein [Anaeromyxobacter oryzae]BDG05557.1 thiamine biosynthesis protein ThiF [Anaeromyxobacter oryzae]
MATERMHAFLRERAEGDLLPWRAQCDLAERFDASLGEIEDAALAAGLLPGRYRRNRETVSVEEQLRLFRSRVVVIGCGGLGGYLVEQLARIGVGELALVDPDVFEEHNLNRQLLSSPAHLGRAKVEVGCERVAAVNPAVTTSAHRVAFSLENARGLLAGSAAVVDGLDNTLVRRDLAAVCRELGVPLVHGAIAGWYGQVAAQLPGDDLSPLLRSASASGRGVEATLGNPSFTPAVIASLQVAEVVKVLLGRGRPLSGRSLFVDLLDMRFEEIGHA